MNRPIYSRPPAGMRTQGAPPPPPSGARPSVVLYAAFFLFVVSVAIEAIKLGGNLNHEGSMVGPTKVTGYLLFLVAVFDYKAALLPVHRPLLWLWGYVAVGLIGTMVLWSVVLVPRVLTTPQNLVLFWIACNVLRWETGWRLFLVGLLVGVGFASLAQLTGFGVSEKDVAVEYIVGMGMMERASALGEDPNFAASYRALGVIVVAMLVLDSRVKWKFRIIAIMIGLVASASIAGTGSRGSLLVVGCGFLLFIALQRSWSTRFVGALLATASILGFAAMVASSPAFMERVRSAWETGDTAKRMDIWLEAVRLLWDSPIYGFGLQTYSVPLGLAVGASNAATHNLLLSILLSSGFVGTAFFVAALWHIVRACVRYRRDPDVAMAFVQLGTVMAAGMSLNVELKKWFWLVLAAAYARGFVAEERAKRSRAVNWRTQLVTRQ